MWSSGRSAGTCEYTTGSIRGAVEEVSIEAGQVIVKGWAVDSSGRVPADWFLLFSGPRLMDITRPYLLRPDLAATYGRGALLSGVELRAEVERPRRSCAVARVCPDRRPSGRRARALEALREDVRPVRSRLAWPGSLRTLRRLWGTRGGPGRPCRPGSNRLPVSTRGAHYWRGDENPVPRLRRGLPGRLTTARTGQYLLLAKFVLGAAKDLFGSGPVAVRAPTAVAGLLTGVLLALDGRPRRRVVGGRARVRPVVFAAAPVGHR